ncbi:MAG: hypothetical protein QF659_03875 [Dehalococcoidia bacterium]|jgi:hypothetical protein|nr:hypothetical protein [Dehalococcoidia bacterium]
MKPKLMAILVIGVLAVSMVLTLAGAVGQAVTGDASGQGGPSASLAEDGAGQDDGTLVSSFKFVCPFH